MTPAQAQPVADPVGVSYSVTGLPALAIFVILGFAAYGWPMMIIARRVGLSRWWGLFVMIPVVNILAYWLFALRPWPREPGMADPNVFK